MTGLRLAFGLLTAVPVGSLPAPDRRRAAHAMLLAPLTTLPLLLVLAVGHLAVAHARTPALVVAVVVVAAEALVTRSMHLDGLADTADGLSAGYDAQTSLRAMKASDIGPSGVVALVVALLLQVACLAALLPSAGGLALAVVAWLTSRHALAWATRAGCPPAQPGGLGALVASSVPRPALAAAVVVTTCLAVVMSVVAGASWWPGPVVVAAGVAAVLVLLRRCTRRLGGITGDVLGASVEVALATSLLAGAALAGWVA